MVAHGKAVDDELPSTLPAKPPGWGARHTVVVLGFLGFAASYAMRFNLSLAIVAMVNNTKHHPGQTAPGGLVDFTQTSNMSNILQLTTPAPIHSDTCPELKALDLLQKEKDGMSAGDAEGEFNWNEAEQGVILGSFFWGYVLTQLPGGIISQKYGGKWPLGIGLLITAIFALITPLAARIDKSFLIFVRVIQGLGEGLTTPAFHVILANWAPPQERSNLGSIAYAGAQFGTAATMIVSGAIIHSNFLGGWPAVFYVMGALTLVWFVLWCFLMFDSPADHPRISHQELIYIQRSLGEQSSKENVKTPWLKIFTSIHVWAIIIGHTGHTWGLYTLLTELPTYMKSVLHFDIKQNSWMSAMPYILMWILSMLLTKVADFLIQKKIFRVVVVRKICQTTAHWGSALALIAASYSGCDRVLTVALLTIAVGINGAVYGGYVVNHVDIAANHAGILMGITNTFSNLCGFGAPYIAGIIINENTSLERWQLVFFIAAGVYFVEALAFDLLATSTEQPWNRPVPIFEHSDNSDLPLRKGDDEISSDSPHKYSTQLTANNYRV